MASPLTPRDHRQRTEAEGRWRLRVTSYRLGETYHATVDNIDPGAVVSRAQGKTREEAEARALDEARRAVRATRVMG